MNLVQERKNSLERIIAAMFIWDYGISRKVSCCSATIKLAVAFRPYESHGGCIADETDEKGLKKKPIKRRGV